MDSQKSPEYWVGFDLGGTKMLALVFDSDFKVVARKRRRTKGHRGVDSGLKRIVETISDALELAEIEPSDLKGIGIGCPGPLDLDAGVILEAPNLGWERAPVTETLTDAFGCPAVILNDVDSGVYGEHRFGAGQDSRCVLGIFPGTGIGGGCVYEGQILRGAHSSCLELGHMQVMPNGPLCGCGQRGCLEALASRLAIAAAAAQAAYRGQAPHLRAEVGTDISEIRSGAIAASIAAGDTAVEAIVVEAARHIGVAVAGLVNFLSPDRIVLGGGLVEAIPDLFLNTIELTANENALPSYRGTFRIEVAKLGDDAAAMGAAAWIQHQLGYDTPGA